ncbi:MAG: heparinase II/III family protein, partial [Fidelibacterota bacterium]
MVIIFSHFKEMKRLSEQLKVFLSIAFIFLLIRPTVAKAVMSDREFFNSVNLDYPGLGSIKSALISGDTALAKTKLLEYYQNHSSVQYFKLSGS